MKNRYNKIFILAIFSILIFLSLFYLNHKSVIKYFNFATKLDISLEDFHATKTEEEINEISLNEYRNITAKYIFHKINLEG